MQITMVSVMSVTIRPTVVAVVNLDADGQYAGNIFLIKTPST